MYYEDISKRSVKAVVRANGEICAEEPFTSDDPTKCYLAVDIGRDIIIDYETAGIGKREIIVDILVDSVWRRSIRHTAGSLAGNVVKRISNVWMLAEKDIMWARMQTQAIPETNEYRLAKSCDNSIGTVKLRFSVEENRSNLDTRKGEAFSNADRPGSKLPHDSETVRPADQMMKLKSVAKVDPQEADFATKFRHKSRPPTWVTLCFFYRLPILSENSHIPWNVPHILPRKKTANVDPHADTQDPARANSSSMVRSSGTPSYVSPLLVQWFQNVKALTDSVVSGERALHSAWDVGQRYRNELHAQMVDANTLIGYIDVAESKLNERITQTRKEKLEHKKRSKHELEEDIMENGEDGESGDPRIRRRKARKLSAAREEAHAEGESSDNMESELA